MTFIRHDVWSERILRSAVAYLSDRECQSRIFLALALSTVTGVALAQTTPPAPATTPAPAAQTTTPAPAQQSNVQNGLRTANTATVAIRFIAMKPSDLMSSRIIGVNVYNNQNESLGEIEDLVIENGKTITGVVVSVGGFLGMGESYVSLDPATVVLNEKDGSWRAYVDTSKDNLRNAPKFKYTKKKN